MNTNSSDRVAEELVRAALRDTFTAALKSPPGGNAQWDDVLKSLGLTPGTPDERAAVLHDRKQSRGALIGELHEALRTIVEKNARVLPHGTLGTLRRLPDLLVEEYVEALHPDPDAITPVDQFFAPGKDPSPSRPG